jgi:hypothetical protein
MKLYRTYAELMISGSVSELQEVRTKIEGINDGGSIEIHFNTEGDAQPFDALEKRMIVRTGEAPAFAEISEGIGVVLTGNIESLLVFASFFDFEAESEAGSHNHWDEACDSNYVSLGTLPIVVAVA